MRTNPLSSESELDSESKSNCMTFSRGGAAVWLFPNSSILSSSFLTVTSIIFCFFCKIVAEPSEEFEAKNLVASSGKKFEFVGDLRDTLDIFRIFQTDVSHHNLSHSG